MSSNFFTNDGAGLSSVYDAWETPFDFFSKLNSFYKFSLDAAASKENAKCKKFFTKEDDALIIERSDHVSQDDIVFCNPPYSRNLKKWIEKFKIEAEKGVKIVALIPARTETSYWHDFIFNSDFIKVKFLRGRLKFEKNKIPGNSAPFGSALIYYNLDIQDDL